jgi:hypothetical protein
MTLDPTFVNPPAPQRPATSYQVPPADPEAVEPSRIRREWYPYPIQPLPEDWTLEKIRTARKQHDIGNFTDTVRLRDVLTIDPRIESGLMQRCATPIGLTVDVTASEARGGRGVSALAKNEVTDWFDRGSRVAGHTVRRRILEDLVMAGVAIAQVHWRFDEEGGWWRVWSVEPWPLEFAFFNPSLGAIQLITTDGLLTPRHGDGKWLVIERFGMKSWMHGAVRALSTPWADRAFGIRYRAGHAQRHGSPAPVGELPEGIPIDSADGKAFQKFVKALWQGRPWAVKPLGAKVELLEARTTAWQVFNDIVKTSDSDIAITLLGQDGTQAKGGVYTSPQFKGVRFDLVQDDAQTLDGAFETGLALPYASINYGAEFVPHIESAVPDPEEDARKASAARDVEAFARGVISLRAAGFTLTPDYVEDMATTRYRVTAPKLDANLGPIAPTLPPALNVAKPGAVEGAHDAEAMKPTPAEKDDD